MERSTQQHSTKGEGLNPLPSKYNRKSDRVGGNQLLPAVLCNEELIASVVQSVVASVNPVHAVCLSDENVQYVVVHLVWFNWFRKSRCSIFLLIPGNDCPVVG